MSTHRWLLVTRRASIVGLVLGSSFALPAHADVNLGGYIKSFVFQQVTEPYQLDRAGARLQLSVRGASGDFVSFYAATDFELDNRLMTTDQPASRGLGYDVYPVEAYVNLSRGPLELRFGQQFIFWGRTAWEAPTDVISPWNYPDMASEVEDYRIAPFAARANWYIRGELMADLVWVPLFRPSRIGSTGMDELDGVPVLEAAPIYPDATLKNGEFGGRLAHSISEWALDWSVSAYKGFEKMPEMLIQPHFPDDAADGQPYYLTLTRRYAPLWMMGLDLAKAVGPVVVKGETAYKLSAMPADDTSAGSRLESVLGLDFVLSQDLDFGAEYISEWRIDATDASDPGASMSGSPGTLETDPLVHSMLLRVNFKLFPTLAIQFIGVYNLTYQDYFGLGFVSWNIADSLEAFVGGVGFGGASALTPYAMQKDNSRAFVELKYSF